MAYNYIGVATMKGGVSMKESYTIGEYLHNNQKKVTVKVKFYDVCKYNENPKKEDTYEAKYRDVVAWDEIKGGKEAKDVEMLTELRDDYHEYLILHLLNGEKVTLRNSYCDMII